MPENPPKLLATAPSHFAKTAREAAARDIAAEAGVEFNDACELIERAGSLVAKLDPADRRHMELLRFQRDSAEVTRGLSQRGGGLYQRAALACVNGASEIATTAGAKNGTPLHTAVRAQLLHPQID